MLLKLMLFRCNPPTTHLFLSPHPNFLFPPAIFSLFRSASFSPTSLSLSYGPSLQKGIAPPPPLPLIDHQNHSRPPFEEDDFTRVFEISALRVPSDRCYDLENRLRGHLLNWTRVRNIARVSGDEIDSQTIQMLNIRNGDGENDEELGGVLYRNKLAKEFNARGFVNFRNLARISRPNKRKKKEEEEEEEGKRRSRGKGSVVVELVEEGSDDGGDLSELLGDEFKGGKWRGSTRLLLLDERYAGRNSDDELPEAIKAVLSEGSGDAKSIFELVRCKLTLFYEYWSMNEVLESLLPTRMIIPSAFETVGHIAHLNLKDEHLPYKKVIAKAILDKNKPKIQTVVNKSEAISNDYRTMQLELLYGNNSLVTTVIENGMRFQVDLATVYWNSRLATERQRLISCFTSDDVLCDVFSGVGPLAISAAKKVKRVYANDLNPCAVDYLERNCVLNKLERKIKVFNMDGRRFIDAMFSNEKGHSITQVVMNLPNDAVEFLDAFRGIFRDRPRGKDVTLPMIHVYGFSRAEDPEFDFHERIRVALTESAVSVEMRRVRVVAPGKWMLCASFLLPEKVVFSKSYVEYE